MAKDKSKKQLRAEAKALAEARKLTGPKLLRLTLKSMLFAVLVSAIVMGLSLAGVTMLQRPFIQFGIMGLVYLVAFPYLMSEFRPLKHKKSGK